MSAVIGANDRGFDTHIGCAFDQDLAETACVSCGQCIVVCPTGALRGEGRHRRGLAMPWPTRPSIVIVQTAPSVRATLGEGFGMPIGTNVEGKMVAALRRLGFDKVFDTDFAADLTIMEEATELLERMQERRRAAADHLLLPRLGQVLRALLSRNSSANLSTCKSPQQMFGAVIKTYYAEKTGIDPEEHLCGQHHALHRQEV